ncbi:uncharacterized protein LOC108163805 [Drosophila miranda]|uniref:uncharacterized protein LOC108163805 n=1 Tax=Drosophila miranda TaxID=7229 RepID=UPI0007E6CD75|nr:uncharacterized protein LOC108163805 [Drosophila miranda]
MEKRTSPTTPPLFKQSNYLSRSHLRVARNTSCLAAESTVWRRFHCSRTREMISAVPPSAGPQLRDAGQRTYALPQTESYLISPRQTESYPNITEAYSRQTESYPSRIEAHALQDPNLTNHRLPSTWPSTTRTLTVATKGGSTRATRL